MKKVQSAAVLSVFVLLISACNKKDGSNPLLKVTLSNETVTLNPYRYAPLTATIHVETSVPTTISITVAGKNGPASDVVKEFDDVSTVHDVPVLGLYPNYNNPVTLNFKDASGNDLGQKGYSIQTDPLPAGIFPSVTINTKQEGMMTPGMTLVSYFGYKDNPFPQYPFIFDEFGDIRWYLAFQNSPVLNNLFYDDGMERLQNGNFYFGDINSNTIYEVNYFGKTINTWSLPGYQFHHNVQEKPNGNFLVSVSKQGDPTVEDYIIELDRNSKSIVQTWDLKQSLQYSRQILTTDAVDWIHVNAVIYDASDNSIIISGRTQGVVKLDQDNNVVWILGCHKGWGISGNGTDLTKLLLQPVDKNGTAITDQDVLDGVTNHPDFEWNWYQHAPKLMPDGDVLLFDNGGGNRNFSGAGFYSRAVAFRINKTNKTVQQIWEYGKERGLETYAPIVSDVDYASGNNHVIFSPGSVSNTTTYGKAVEVDYTTGAVVFEATITPPQSFYGITFHRTERLTLYP